MQPGDNTDPGEEFSLSFFQEQQVQLQRRQMEHHMMHVDEIRASVRRFMEELTGDQLFILTRMMNTAAAGLQSGENVAMFWAGQASMLMDVKFNMNPYTGEKNPTLEDLLAVGNGKTDETPA